jgi:hypothetical protein
MPLKSVPSNAAILASCLESASCIGVSSSQLALGIATGLEIYSDSIIVTSVDVGTLGAGTGTGFTVMLDPPGLISTMTTAFADSAIAGVMAVAIATAISVGLVQVFAFAQIQTVNPTVGVGTGVCLLTPNPVASAAAFVTGFISAGLVGVSSAAMATAVSVGLDSALPSAIAEIVIAGSPSIVPSSGAGVGVLL